MAPPTGGRCELNYPTLFSTSLQEGYGAKNHFQSAKFELVNAKSAKPYELTWTFKHLSSFFFLHWKLQIRRFENDPENWKKGSILQNYWFCTKTFSKIHLADPEWNRPKANKAVINWSVAVIIAKNHKRQRRKHQSVTAKWEKSQTPKVLTAILNLPNLT